MCSCATESTDAHYGISLTLIRVDTTIHLKNGGALQIEEKYGSVQIYFSNDIDTYFPSLSPMSEHGYSCRYGSSFFSLRIIYSLFMSWLPFKQNKAVPCLSYKHVYSEFFQQRYWYLWPMLSLIFELGYSCQYIYGYFIFGIIHGLFLKWSPL